MLMKCFLPVCFILIFLSSCKQQTFYDKVTVWPGDRNLQSLDRNNGFKDLKLGRHISALIHYLEKNGQRSKSGYTVYQVKPDSLAKFKIEEVSFKSIEAHFSENLLSKFKMELEGENNSFPFFLLLLDAYGGAQPEDTRPETYEWNGNRVRLKYTVSSNRDAVAEFTSAILKPIEQ